MKTVPLAKILVKERHRKDLGDVRSLADSIDKLGLLHPLVVTPEFHLVAGLRRLEAVKLLGWDNVRINVVEGLDDVLKLLQAERDENTCRKEFVPEEAVSIGRALEKLERPKAKERQAQAGPTEGKGTKPSGSANFAEPLGRTRDKVGEAVGMSGYGYEKAKAVVEAAEEDPETFGAIKEEMNRTGKIDPAFKKVQEVKNPTPPAPPPRHPHSDRINHWLLMVMGEMTAIRVAPGGLEKLLSERDKWDWHEVREVILPTLYDLRRSLNDLLKEVKDAAQ